MRTYQNINYGTLPAQVLDIYLPDRDTDDIFVYFHGGGLGGGDKSEKGLSSLYKTVTDAGVAMVSANYRMYPAAKYPDFIDDAARCVAFVKEHISEYCSCKNIYVGGSSAGGYLSMMLCFDKRWLGKYNISNEDISGYVHDAGQPTAHFNVLNHSGIDSKRVIVDETAPLFHIGIENDYPRMHFIVSDNDMEGRFEQTMLALATLKHFGHKEKVSHVIMHGTHCHYVGLTDENGDNVLAKIASDFILNHK